MTDITFVQKGFKLDNKAKTYISEKLMKHERLLSKAINISVLVRLNENYNPDKRYKMEISVKMPHTFIKVEERGLSTEMLVDSLEVTLKRKIKRYLGLFKKWEKQEPWKISEAKESVQVVSDDNFDYSNYQPAVKISKLESIRPMHIGEAIERLEMSGKNAILFRNYETELYGMLYKDDSGQYELTEADV